MTSIDPLHEPSPSAMGRPKRIALAIGGSLAVGLAFLGAALPLLPTAPFVLLAGICFAKAWPRADAWLYRHRIFGPFRRMRAGGEPVMTPRFKAITIGITILSFGTTLLLTSLYWVWQACLVLTCVGIVTFLARQPTLPSGSD